MLAFSGNSQQDCVAGKPQVRTTSVLRDPIREQLMVMITDEVRASAREQAEGRCECQGQNCRHHRRGARCKRGLRGDQWKVYWRVESGGTARDNIEAWCLECFKNNFTVPSTTVTILRSEIFGYAGLADDDQRKAITLMSVFLDAAARVAESKRGRMLKTAADEAGSEFVRSADAVDAALELEPRFHESALKLGLPTPPLCSGIHCGEVTRTRTGDLMGDALTVASQVKSMAAAGQIVLSESTVSQLGRRIDLEEIKHPGLNGAAEPLPCWAVRR